MRGPAHRAASKRLVVVGNVEDLKKERVVASSWNWLRRPSSGEALWAKVRYRSPATAVESCIDSGEGLEVQLRDPVSAVAPGQSLVLYGGTCGAEVLGGGTIAPEVDGP